MIVPCYNESLSLRDLVFRASQLIDSFSSILRKQLEVIFVENGSTDNSRSLLFSLIDSDNPSMKLVLIDSNVGYGNGIYQGLINSTGSSIGWTHADLQCDLFDFFRAAQYIETSTLNTAFYLKGTRYARPLFDKIFTFGMSVFESFLFLGIYTDINAQPCLFPRSLLSKIVNPPLDFSFDLYLYHIAYRSSFAIIRFPVLFVPRAYGTSSWNTSFLNKVKFIKRTLSFSLKLKFHS